MKCVYDTIVLETLLFRRILDTWLPLFIPSPLYYYIEYYVHTYNLNCQHNYHDDTHYNSQLPWAS